MRVSLPFGVFDVFGLVGKLSLCPFVWFDAGNYSIISEFILLEAKEVKMDNFKVCARRYPIKFTLGYRVISTIET